MRVRVNISLQPEELAELDRLADALGSSRSATIRILACRAMAILRQGLELPSCTHTEDGAFVLASHKLLDSEPE